MRVVTIYGEKYKPRTAIERHRAMGEAEAADACFMLEQGEMEIPSYDKQRRVYSVIRFERIIQADAPSAQEQS